MTKNLPVDMFEIAVMIMLWSLVATLIFGKV